MESGSSRTRIDQFFTSKKKKSLSPGLKPRRIEKDAKPTLEGSPGAKGSLDSYLVTSQDDNRTTNILLKAPGPFARQDPVKRNLTLEIDLSSKDEKKEAFSSIQGCPQTSEAAGEAKREQFRVPSEVGDLAVRGLAKGCSDPVHSAGNSELKQFAADFLSFYCSELPSSVSSPSEPETNAHKRHGSPSVLVVEDRSIKRRHCIIDGDQSQTKGETPCCSAPTDIIAKSGEAVFNYSREVIVGNGTIEHQASLRKCNKASAGSGCDTPGPLTIKAGARETPRSSRGSSIFSPGEAFWNEAIHVADGLFATNDNLSFGVAEEINLLKSQCEIKNSNNMRNGGCVNKSNGLLDEGASKICNSEVNASFGSLGKHGKILDKEASPLPVKHFDFSFVEKNLDADTPTHCLVDNMKDLMPIDGEQTGCVSVSNKSLQTTNITTHGGEACFNSEMHEVQGMPINCAVAKRKAHYLSQDNDSITSNTPDMKIRGCNKDSTPSNFALVEDRLDLSNWLPSEICSIYEKRGISKLYPWLTAFRWMVS